MIFHEEYARSGAPARVNHLGEELLGPTLIAFGTPEQQERFLPQIVAVEELWCQGYSEPGAGSDLANVQTKARLRRRRVGRRRAEGVDLQRPRGRLVLRGRPHRARLASATTACPSCWSRSTRTASRSARSSSSPAARSSTRSSSPAPAPPPTSSSASRATAGRSRWGCSASSAASPRSASRSASRASSTASSSWRATNGTFDDPVIRDRLAQAKVELEVMRVNALRGLSAAVAGEGSSSGGGAASIGKLVWANWHRSLGELAMAVAGPDGADRCERAVRPRPVAAALPLLPRRHDLRRQRRDPAQHPRRARARPARRSPADDRDHGPEQPAPDYVPGHDLLAGKVVVVTAAAGAGIGAAVVRRALEEGAKAVVFSDTHERRLAEAEQVARRRSSAPTGSAAWSATSPTRTRCRRCSTRPTSSAAST